MNKSAANTADTTFSTELFMVGTPCVKKPLTPCLVRAMRHSANIVFARFAITSGQDGDFGLSLFGVLQASEHPDIRNPMTVSPLSVYLVVETLIVERMTRQGPRMDEPAQLMEKLRVLARGGSATKFDSDVRSAFSYIYDKFKRRVFAFVLKKVRHELPPGCEPAEFVHDLFIRFVRFADRFKPSNTHSLADIERQLLYTLHVHAGYMIADLRRANQMPTHCDLLELPIPVDTGNSPRIHELLERLELAMARLDERSRDVVIRSNPYYDNAERQFLVPDDVRAEIKAKWQLNSDNDIVVMSIKLFSIRCLSMNCIPL